MKTPIYDFLRSYGEKDGIRAHMPGHKGKSFLGCEALDLTEITGADSLFEAEGIIAESEKNASALFGCPTFYSTEGSSLCIRAMLWAVKRILGNERPTIVAPRNCHKVFINTASMLGIEVKWLWKGTDRLSFEPDIEELENILSAKPAPGALFVTSPDYPGNILDIRRLAELCHRYGVLLLVDCAHGAYLKFTTPSLHPMDLGADICCSSAHKTLPVLTGGAYLHISTKYDYLAKEAMALFASTSPSYLTLASLDLANDYLEGEKERLSRFIPKLEEIKRAVGDVFLGSEPLKLSLDAAGTHRDGRELAKLLRDRGIEPEYADRDMAVLMLSPENTDPELEKIKTALVELGLKREGKVKKTSITPLEKVMEPAEASLLPKITASVGESIGRILACARIACPPAVPIVMGGERISREAAEAMAHYGIESCEVVSDELYIRKAKIEDIDDICSLYEKARLFMAEAGNPTQWQGGYPQRELIERDIANGYCHLCCKEGECVAVFYFRIGDDPTYKRIYGGKWLSDGDYGVLHRIAVGLHGEGVAAKCFDFCLGRCKSLRLDTHRDNLPMQKALKKHGFTYCGVIYIENGDERIAFEKISK